jgi:hypothetical protein
VNLLVDPDNPTDTASPADWVELPQGGTVVVQTVASETKTFSWGGPKVFRGYSLREITSSTAPVNIGTGAGPTQVVS